MSEMLRLLYFYLIRGFLALTVLVFCQNVLAQHHDEKKLDELADIIKVGIINKYNQNKAMVNQWYEANLSNPHADFPPEIRAAKEQMKIYESKSPICPALGQLMLRDYTFYISECQFEALKNVCTVAADYSQDKVSIVDKSLSKNQMKSELVAKGKEKPIVEKRAMWIKLLKWVVSKNNQCRSVVEDRVLGPACRDAYHMLIQRARENKDYIADKCSVESIDQGLERFKKDMDRYAQDTDEAKNQYAKGRKSELAIAERLVEIDDLIKNLEKNRKPASKTK